MNYVIYLVIIAVVIILSQISLYISKRASIEGTVIIPLIIGFILKALLTKDRLRIDLNELTPIFLSLAGISLIFFVFESASKPKIRIMDTSHKNAFQLFLLTFLLNMIILTFFTSFISGVSIIIAMFFSLVFTSTSPIFFNDWESKVREILSKEAVIATPILFVLGYFIYDTITLQNGVPHFFAQNLEPYILELIVGLGVGILIAIVFFNTIRKFYKNKISTLMTLIVAVAAYLLTEFLGGDGVVGTAMFAIFFGNMHLENKEKTTLFLEKILKPLLTILILTLGFVVGFRININLLFESLALLTLILIIRFISTSLVFYKNHTLTEKLHLTLNTQHGATLVIILLLFALRGFSETNKIIQISILLLIYTSIISALASLYDHMQKTKEKEQII